MQMILNEDQTMLAETVRRFVDEHSPLERFRNQRDAGNTEGYSPELWAKMAEMGWQALVLPEEHGGLDLGMAELAIVMDSLGRNLAGEPFLSTVLLAGGMLQTSSQSALAKKWLPKIALGEAIATVAYDELGRRYDRSYCKTTATVGADSIVLSGTKHNVLNGASADLILVVARTSGSKTEAAGLTLLAVDPKAPGVEISPQTRIDHRGAATVCFRDVEVSRTNVLGEIGGAAPVIEAVFDRAVVGLAAEMVGSATHAFEITLAYMRERKQFGVAIASFQALQHRMAKVFTQIQMANSAVLGASRAIDDGSADASKLASLAKTKAGQALELAAKEGIQMHGGVGMTDEYDIGFFLKRARAAETTLGDQAWHRKRWAELSGY
ncbi:MAG: alkylation response protein AidB-like acyl-CoA dehydrogenase [Bradymonadia bacterium]|jgi:alkylation response protein AidB-like acyl-CoA dehydrogenase